MRLGHIQRQSAIRRAESEATQCRQVVFRNDPAGIRRPQVGYAVLVGALEEVRPVVQLVITVFTSGKAEARYTGPEQLRHRRVRHHEGLGAAIHLGDGDGQITGITSVIEVIEDERPRGDGGLIENVRALTHSNLRVGIRHTANGRSEAAHGVRQHAVVAGQLHASERDAVEYLARGVVLPKCQL
ncbi:hypothetical protein D9M70_543660 [compost metagenome]